MIALQQNGTSYDQASFRNVISGNMPAYSCAIMPPVEVSSAANSYFTFTTGKVASGRPAAHEFESKQNKTVLKRSLRRKAIVEATDGDA